MNSNLEENQGAKHKLYELLNRGTILELSL
jgi:hypothetical protein